MSWAEVKNALNSTLGTPNFEPLDKQAQDLDTALRTFLQSGNVPVVKSVQRGVVNEYTATKTLTYTKGVGISSVNPNKCIVLFERAYPMIIDEDGSKEIYPHVEEGVNFSYELKTDKLNVTQNYYKYPEITTYFYGFTWQVIEFY